MKTVRMIVVVFGLLVLTNVALGDAIWNIKIATGAYAAIQNGQQVNITFEYKTGRADGVRIFARPMTGGALSPSYGAHGSGVYPTGSGSGTAWFTITTGNVLVDAIRFQVVSPDQSTLVLEFSVPVHLIFSPHAIYNIAVTPKSPASMQFNQQVDITFDYRTSEPGGVVVFARPMTGTSTTPNYGAHGSPTYPTGQGSGTGYFTIMGGDATVDGIRFRMSNASQSTLLLELVIPANYQYHAHSIADVQFTPALPAALTLNSDLNISFTYRTSEASGVRIFPRPFTQGGLSPGYAASGSPAYATGSGAGTGSFTITAGDVTVDSVRFRMTNLDQSTVLLDYFVPINCHFSAHTLSNIVMTPPSPAYLTPEENTASTFNYSTVEASGVRIWMRPFSQGSLSQQYGAHGSPLYPVGSGSGSGWFHMGSESALVDQVRFVMAKADQSQDLLEWFLPVELYYRNMTAVAVEMPEEGLPMEFDLAQNFPNPFNPTTTIRYQVPTTGASGQQAVRLAVYDLLGRHVATLADEPRAPGYYSIAWDGAGLASGIYICRMNAGGFSKAVKMILAR
jgi:hypothetical protein